MRHLVPSAGTRATAVLLALLCLGLAPSAARAQDPPPGAGAAPSIDSTPDPWKLGDDIGTRVDARWNPARGLYMNERGFPDTRLNSLLLQLMSMAALAGHQGPIRHDERIEPLVKVLTSAPVLVVRSLRPRQVGHFPHAPAWTPAIGEEPEQAVLHPSIDTSVVRSLTAAWRVRDLIGMAPETSARIAQVLTELAASPFYKFPSRALNQMNWHTEVYSAALEVAGDTSILPDYRAQLMRFADLADRADKTEWPGGSSYLTSGGGFRYLPNRSKNAQLNKVETTEYGNLALSSLGMYQAAIRAGMVPLPEKEIQVLKRWSRHMLLGSWTHAGYPNWDTGLGTKRRHLRQYWAWSLDGLMTASGPDALLGYPQQRSFARSIASHGIALYLATAWAPTSDQVGGPLPGKTSFDAPNGFTTGSGNELIGPLRFAVLDASLDSRFQDVSTTAPPNWYAQDEETGRFAFSTPVYNGAILPGRAGQSQGGLEPVRLFDGEQRPLTALGGRGTGSLGLSIVKDGRITVDTEPATPGRQTTTDVAIVGKPENTASAFGSPVEVRGVAKAGGGRIAVRQLLTTDRIESTYEVSKIEKGSRVAVRVPVWDQNSRIDITSGAVLKGGRWVRTKKPLQMTGVTPDGGRFVATFSGIPRSAELAITTVRPDGYRPRGARQLLVVFGRPKTGDVRIVRRIDVARPS
ncbi:MAG: hypothetical protein Q7T55_17120 [Solirubrobacteraceae bacterium]|nr:hypothetical protein [Solirubrobacteraceae bacterium]